MTEEEPEPIRRRPGGRAARVRQAVLAAAMEVLTEEGIARLSIAEVAARAGVNETTVYRRWGSREKLVLDAMLAGSDEGIPVPDTGAVRTDLAAFAHALADYLATPTGRSVARAASLSADDPDLAKAWQAFWKSRLDQAGVIVSRAVERGELPADTDVALALELLCSPLQTRSLLGHRPIEPELPQRLADLVLDGLRGRNQMH
ncbi:TetR/AcrR family transcriptional regulator [Streptomyces sp. NBC_00257]|uniref:TetR/AcrR family transcriptional regulator n=1 Tax=unclassified Streptomyces TaxID=2593676 RepID=UPI0022516378|nr:MULTISPECIES: TetR/AcrR family transcriptional regulator [unclassified Streptomyces]MCX5426558.1 TetR/AcrR family transcriptional regulator [Streptomyces sp. NBC_00062]WSW03419.1 TetR/AcrR family transcriptional regulator [Streptomyces sp. NBC_01005]WTC92922.1 TetR/AcrR family transcriptional regulator [Streptomyces sp. NBC_01650]